MNPRWWKHFVRARRVGRFPRNHHAFRWPALERLEGRSVLSGTLGAPLEFAPPLHYLDGAVTRGLVTGDFNGDSRADVVVSDELDHSLTFRPGFGDGTLGPPLPATPTGALPGALAAGDFNNDGKLDLVVATPGTANLTLHLGNGNGAFQNGIPLSPFPDIQEIHVNDVNKDGDMDLILLQPELNQISYLRGSGNGSFSSPRNTTLPTTPTSMALSDYNGDGKLDIAISQVQTNSVVFIDNKDVVLGGRGLNLEVFPVGIAPGHVAAADYDGDGLSDLLVANKGSNDLSLLRGNNQNGFDPENRIPIGLAPVRIQVGDFNNDSTIDLLVALDGENRLAYVRGCGDGTFLPGLRVGIDPGPGASDVADLNGDGLLDFVLATPAANKTSIYLNRSGIVAGFATSYTPIQQAGVAFSLTLQAVDHSGQLLSNYLGTIHFQSTDQGAILPPDTTFTLADAGNKTVLVTLLKSGPQTVLINDIDHPGLSTFVPFFVDSGPVSHFGLMGFPPIRAGESGTFTVVPQDVYGNPVPDYVGTIHFTSTDPQADLPQDFSFAPEYESPPSFTTTLRTAGMQTLHVVDQGVPSITGSLTGILVIPADASQLVVTGFPTSVTAGVPQAFTVTALDPFGNVATGYTGTIEFASSDVLALLPSPTSFQIGDAGTRTLVATLGTVGSQLISIHDHTNSLNVNSPGIQVTPGPAAGLRLSPLPGAQAGIPTAVTVTVIDALGNLVPDYLGTIHLASDDPRAVLPPDTTFTLADGGSRTFPVTFKTAGNHTLTVQDIADVSLSSTMNGIVVIPGAPTGFRIDTPPTFVAGTAGMVVVTPIDGCGNPVFPIGNQLHFSSSDSAATLPDDYTFNLQAGGSPSFPLIWRSAGTHTLTITDLTWNYSSTVSVTVVPGVAVRLDMTSPTLFDPTGVVAGVDALVAVTAFDAFDNIASGYLGTVQWTSEDSHALLPSAYTFTPGDGGHHVFTLSLRTSGAHRVQVMDRDNPSLTMERVAQVNPGNAVRFQLDTPLTALAGAPGSATLTALDAFNNRSTGYLGTVRISSTDRTATLPSDLTFSGSDGGKIDIPFTFRISGTQRLFANEIAIRGQTQGIQATSPPIAVSPAAANTLLLTTPGFVRAGEPFFVTLRAQDPFGNLATGYAGTVHFSSDDPQGTLPADWTFAPTDGGVHTFPITLRTSGFHPISVNEVSQGPLSTEAMIQVSAAAASSLDLDIPGHAVAGEPFIATVTARDPFGNISSHFAGTIHWTATDPRAILPPDTTFTANDGGIRNFVLELRTAGMMQLTAEDTALGLGISSPPLAVRSASATSLEVTAGPTTAAGVPWSFTITARDAFGNIAEGYQAKLSFQSDDPRALLPPPFDFTPTEAGTRSFQATLVTAGPRQLILRDDGLAPLTVHMPILVLPATPVNLVLESPLSTRAGAGFPTTATFFDVFGNRVTNYSGVLRVTSTDPQAGLPKDIEVTHSLNGMVTFAANLRTSGSHTVTLSEISGNTGLSATTSEISVAPAEAARLVLSAPRNVMGGIPFSLTVTALDAFGNQALDFADTVTFSATGPASLLPSATEFTPQDQGKRIFEGLLLSPGFQTITATPLTTGALAGRLGIAVSVPPLIDPRLQLSLSQTSLMEGDTLELLGQFEALGIRRPIFARVDWGDGSEESSLEIPGGVTSFRISHLFLDDPEGENNSYTIRVTLTDGGPLMGTATVTITVDDAPPVLFPGPDLSLVEQGELVLPSSFLDPGTDTWTVTVDYGDLSPIEQAMASPDRTFTLRHRYTQEGTYFIRITVTDSDGASDTKILIAEVFLPGLTEVRNGRAGAGQTLTLRNGDALAFFERGQVEGEAALLSLVDYIDNPISPELSFEERTILNAHDVRLTMANESDRLKILFKIPPGISGDVRLDFFNQAQGRFRPVFGSNQITPGLVVDQVSGTIAVIFDRTSMPRITNLRGTVFTVSVPKTETRTATVLGPVATASPAAPSLLGTSSASFVSTTSRGLSLAPSETRSLSTGSASLSTAASNNAANGLPVLTVEPPQIPQEASEERFALPDPCPLELDPYARYLPQEWVRDDHEFLPSMGTLPMPLDEPQIEEFQDLENEYSDEQIWMEDWNDSPHRWKAMAWLLSGLSASYPVRSQRKTRLMPRGKGAQTEEATAFQESLLVE